MIFNLFFRYFSICSDYNKFHNELSVLKDIYSKNGYPTSFFDKDFKMFLNKIFLKKQTSDFTC